MDNPYLWMRVRVCWSTGTGCSRKPQGYLWSSLRATAGTLGFVKPSTCVLDLANARVEGVKCVPKYHGNGC